MTREATEVRICNQKGLHARAAAKLVRLAEQYDAAVEVTKDDATVTATSILGLMMLGASIGTRLTLSASLPVAERVRRVPIRA